MNIVLSLPKDLVKRVGKIAVDRDTTLTSLVREYLSELIRQDAATGRERRKQEALERSFEQFQFRVGINLGSATTSMSAREFLDTNILVYAYDRSEPRKQQIAQGLVRRAVAGENAASSQVLGEFAATLLHKLAPRAKPEDVIALLDAFGPIKLVPLDGDVILRAVQRTLSTDCTITME